MGALWRYECAKNVKGTHFKRGYVVRKCFIKTHYFIYVTNLNISTYVSDVVHSV